MKNVSIRADNMNRSLDSIGRLALCFLLAIVSCTSSCTKPESAHSIPVCTIDVRGVETSVGSPNGIAEAIIEAKRATDLVEFFIALQNADREMEEYQKASAELLDKYNALYRQCSPIVIHESLDLVSFQYKMLTESEYRVGFLFRVNKRIDADCRIGLNGVVDRSHVGLLPEVDIQGSRYETSRKDASESWRFHDLEPRTSKWIPGHNVLILRKIQAAPVPHLMKLGLYEMSGDKSRFGDFVAIGWFADISEAQSLKGVSP